MHSFDRARLHRIDDWMKTYVDDGKFPGSTFLLAQGGKIVHRATTGYRAVDEQLPFEEDTIVRIYSMTKPVTTVALMTLVEQGLFPLETPINEFIPEFGTCHALIDGATSLDQVEPCATPTVHQVATHTSGLSYSFNPGLLADSYKTGGLDFPPDGAGLEATAQEVAKQPLAFAPGARWNYSVGIDILGRIIEVATGKSLDQYFADEILQPLGMNDTAFTLAGEKVDRLAHLYTSLDGDPMALGAAGSGVMRQVDNAADSPFRATKTFSGGGGLLSTIDDYFQFAEMLRKGGQHNGAQILSPSTLAFMRRNHLRGDIASMGPKSFAEMPMDGVGFGLGWSVMLDPALARTPGNVGDFSWGGMASTIYWVDPVEDLTCIFLTQLMPSSSYANRPELKALVHGAMS